MEDRETAVIPGAGLDGLTAAHQLLLSAAVGRTAHAEPVEACPVNKR